MNRRVNPVESSGYKIVPNAISSEFFVYCLLIK